MSILTQQGLRASLEAALEFGYRRCESGHSLLQAMMDAKQMFDAFQKCTNLPNEIARIKTEPK